ncbi:hypothetical protein [Variovorax saccharolyticus]|nr:hypothetical protein [Variovorax sp. J31P216]MDM0024111.1 hypothetical protein [Variovorax sp. J31P216]
MNAHRINHIPEPAPSGALDVVLDISLCLAVAAGLVLSVLQPWGAIF